MQSRDENLQVAYLDFLPPSSVVLEATKIATIYWICTVFTGFLWSFSGKTGMLWNRDTPADVFWRSNLADIILMDTVLLVTWFCFVLFFSFGRLIRYCHASPFISKQVYLLVFPWVAALTVALTIAVWVSVGSGQSPTFRFVVSAEVLAALAIEVPIVERWFPKLRPTVIWDLSPECFAVMLGRRLGQPVEQHFMEVMGFREKVMRHMQHGRQNEFSELPQYAYYRSDTLERFQKTLGCLYQTSAHLAKIINGNFVLRDWTMLDVGGGEGTFSSQLLRGLTTKPNCIQVIEPSVTMLSRYRALLAAQHPDVRVSEYPCPLENMVDELPTADFVLASHSLYAVMDLDREIAVKSLSKLLEAANHFTCVILASKNSQAYHVKRLVLAHSGRKDNSSFGEDVLNMLPSECNKEVEVVDSVIDVTKLIANESKLISWLAYFCRVDPRILEPQASFFRSAVLNSAVQYNCLPIAVRQSVQESGALTALGMDDHCMVLLHKECIITSKSRANSRLQVSDSQSKTL